MLPPTSTNSYDIPISTFEPPNNHPVLQTAFLLSFAPDNYLLPKAFLFTFTLPALLFFDSTIQVDGIAHTCHLNSTLALTESTGNRVISLKKVGCCVFSEEKGDG
jgi:hypothetical protein